MHCVCVCVCVCVYAIEAEGPVDSLFRGGRASFRVECMHCVCVCVHIYVCGGVCMYVCMYTDTQANLSRSLEQAWT